MKTEGEKEYYEERSFKDYTAKVWRDSETLDCVLQVLRYGIPIYEMKKGPGGKFEIEHIFKVAEDDLKKIGSQSITTSAYSLGKDITGRGRPNLVIRAWTGGAHCCFDFYIFELAKEITLVAEIHGEDGEDSFLADLDGDDVAEFVGRDYAFAYWRTGFAQSPAPRVILRFQDGGYFVAGDLMATLAPSGEEIEKRVQEIRKDEEWEHGDPPEALWAFMLDLTYSGRADLVPDFCRKAWPEDVPGMDEFLEDFRAQLKMSQYWDQILDMNGGQILQEWLTDKVGVRT